MSQYEDGIMNTPASIPALLLALTTTLLSACGGGGGGGGSGTPTTPPTDNLQTTSKANYAAGSSEHAALRLLNNARGACGFGLLNQNTQLDQAAVKHAQYLVGEKFNDGHNESVSTSRFFTGATTAERINAAGYRLSFLSAQIVTSTGVAKSTAQAEEAVKSLLSAPYHLSGMISGAREVGIAHVESKDVGNIESPNELVFKMLLATPTGQVLQQAAADRITTYPCQGTTGTRTGLFNESPNPIPSRDLRTNPIGQPIVVHAALGQTLSNLSFSVKDPSNNVIDAQLLTSSNDPNKLLLGNEAIIMPLAPLSANTTYRVDVAGKRQESGQAAVDFSVSFSFSTGIANTF